MSALDGLPPILTVEEAAAFLRIGRSAAYAAVRAGEIPSVRIGRSIRCPRCQLEALLGLENGDGPGDESRADRKAQPPTQEVHHAR